MTTTSVLATKSYTGRDFYTIQAELLALLKATRPEDINAFYEGDVGKILIELLSYTGDGIHYAIDRVSEESFIATCRLRESALRFAAGVGYDVAAASGASVNLVPVSYADIPVQVTQNASAREVQTLSFGAAPTSGTFRLTFVGQATLPLQFNTGPQPIQDALAALSNINAGNVTVTGSVGGPFVITFQNALAWIDQPLITVTDNQLKRNEVQRITLTGTPTGGTFTLSYSGQTTAAIAYNATFTAIQAALEALSTLNPGDIVVSGGNNVFTVEFIGPLAGTNVPLMSTASSLTGGTAPNVVIAEITQGASVNPTIVETTKGLSASYSITFAKGQVVTVGSRTWEVSEDTTINGLSVSASNYQTTFRVPLVEGKSFGEEFVSNGSKFQTFTTSNVSVIEGSLEVRTGDPTSTAWTRISALSLAEDASNLYSLRYDASGRAIVSFGDNVQGAIPPISQTVYITGRTGGGSVGNVGPLSIKATLTGTASGGPLGTLTLKVPLTNVASASGGRDAEALEDLRRNILRWIRTVDKALTKEDYDTLAGQYESSNGSIFRAAAYLASAAILYQTSGDPISPASPMTIASGTTLSLGGRTFQFSQTFVVEETDPLIWMNPNTVYVYAWSAGDRGFVGSSDALLADLRLYLQARSVVTTTVVTKSGKNKIINVNLGTVVYLDGYNRAAVEETLQSTAKAFFLSNEVQPGIPFRLSDFYNVLEDIEGVDHFVLQTPSDDISMAKDEMPYLGTLTYTLVSSASTSNNNVAAFGNEIFRTP